MADHHDHRGRANENHEDKETAMTMAAWGASENIRKFRKRLEEEELSDFERKVIEGQLARSQEILRDLVAYFRSWSTRM